MLGTFQELLLGEVLRALRWRAVFVHVLQALYIKTTFVVID